MSQQKAKYLSSLDIYGQLQFQGPLNCFIHNQLIMSKILTFQVLNIGVNDFVQIQISCSHILDLQKPCIYLGIRVINNCPFKLDNLGIKILLDRNSFIQNNYKLIEELPSNSFLYLSQNCFSYITYDTLLIKKLYKKLLSQPFETVILDNTNQVFQYSIKQNLNLDLIAQNVSKKIYIELLSYLINGQNLAIIISNISTQSNFTEVLLEIKSDKSCIESFQIEIDKLLFELSDGLLSVVL